MAPPFGGADDEALVRGLTEIGGAGLCPEIALHLKPASKSFEGFRQSLPRRLDAAPPYWAVAWPGGQALARYLLDNSIVSGRTVVDVGAGSGIAAIAARLAGARAARAVDSDPLAVAACALNGRLNGVAIEAVGGELTSTELEGVHVVVAGDLWYEPHVGRRATALLRSLARRGVMVLAGDPGRAHFPHLGRELMATYRVRASEELEPSSLLPAHVWRLLP